MDGTFYTLHDFMLHTKAVTYILIVVSLCGTALFWRFLTGRDKD